MYTDIYKVSSLKVLQHNASATSTTDAPWQITKKDAEKIFYKGLLYANDEKGMIYPYYHSHPIYASGVY